MNYCERLVQEVSSWAEVSIHPHRFGGTEFRFKSAELGHIHTGGIVDIPFPRPVRDALLADGLPKSTTGCQIRDGSLFTSAARKMPGTRFG